jgi:ubiquinone/menaquinone biosynthesis C-methylase UbiE
MASLGRFGLKLDKSSPEKRHTMGFYERTIVPKLIELAMRQGPIQRYRQGLVPLARGSVLEVGVGSGLNLPLYTGAVREVIGVDPSEPLLDMARRRVSQAVVPIDLQRGSATDLPLESESVDTVVMTWTLCSIPDPLAALREMRRVLKPGGSMLFVEHGLSPEPGVARWQHRLTPLWRRLAGGCHLDRNIDDLVRTAGFDLAQLQTGYSQGPRPMTYMYEGRALRGL